MIRSRGVTGACSICFVLLVAQQSLLLALSSSYAAEAAVHNLLLEPAASKNKVELERSHNTWSRDSTWKRDKSPKSVNVPEISEDKHDHANSICSSINDYLEKNYNSSCELVKQICGDAYELFDYLRFVTCDIGRVNYLPNQLMGNHFPFFAACRIHISDHLASLPSSSFINNGTYILPSGLKTMILLQLYLSDWVVWNSMLSQIGQCNLSQVTGNRNLIWHWLHFTVLLIPCVGGWLLYSGAAAARKKTPPLS